MFGLLPPEPSAEVLVFGSPSETGWCVADPGDQMLICRGHLTAVVASVSELIKHLPKRQTILFTPEPEREEVTPLSPMIPLSLPSPEPEPHVMVHRSQPSDDAVSLGELVNTLHDLNNFFQSDMPFQANPTAPTPRHDEDDAARRVAAILSRSLARPNQPGQRHLDSRDVWQDPPTPFVDLFQAPPFAHASEALRRNFMRTAEEEDDDDDSRSDTAFGHGGDSYFPNSRDVTPRDSHPRTQSGHGSREDWNSDDDEELEASFVMETGPASSNGHESTYTPSSGWGMARRGSLDKVKELLTPRRSPQQSRSTPRH